MSELIRIEDIHRRDNARPLDASLVDAIAASINAIGYREDRPVLVRKDGNIYWLVDGGHRTEACRKEGLTEVLAVVEDMDDASVLTYEGALNLQRPDSEQEKWQRAQEYMILGVDVAPELITVATGLSAEVQEQARRVRRILADDTAFQDTTIFDLPVIAALEGDKDALADYLKTPVKERIWRGPQILRGIDAAATIARIAAECEAAGITVLDKNGPMSPAGLTYMTNTAADLRKRPEGATAVRIESYSNVTLYWYEPATEGQTEAQKAEAAKREAWVAESVALDAAHEARLSFIAEEFLRMERGESRSKALKDYAVARWEERQRLDPRFDVLTGTLSRMLAAVLSDAERGARDVLCNTDQSWTIRDFGVTTEAFMKALTADGYEMSGIEQKHMKQVRAKLKKAKQPEPEPAPDGDSADEGDVE